jgi:hypothetical protein
MSADGRLSIGSRSGAEGARTPDLLAASEALSQLSYSPGKLVIGRPVYSGQLPISGLGKAQLHGSLPRHDAEREQVAPPDFRAMSGNEIDLLGQVERPDLPGGRLPMAHQTDPDHVTGTGGRLALDLEKPARDLEDKVRPPVLRGRFEHRQPQPSRFIRDRGLRHGSTVIWIEHPAILARIV